MKRTQTPPVHMLPSDATYNYATGVTLKKFNHADIYVGTSESLIAAGLASPDQFPGQPGVGVHCARTYPDGTHPLNPRGGGKHPGTKCITKRGKRLFELLIYVSTEESERRHCAQDMLLNQYPASELRQFHHERTRNVIDFAAYKQQRQAMPVQRW
jgi:hypothetical protein